MTNKKEEPEEKEEAWVSTLINEIFNELEIKESWEYKFTSQTGNVTFQDKQSFITFIKDQLKEENWSKEKANIYRDFIIMDIIVEKLEKIKKLSKKKKQDKLDEHLRSMQGAV